MSKKKNVPNIPHFEFRIKFFVYIGYVVLLFWHPALLLSHLYNLDIFYDYNHQLKSENVKYEN